MKFKRILTGILSAAVAFSTLVIPAFAAGTSQDMTYCEFLKIMEQNDYSYDFGGATITVTTGKFCTSSSCADSCSKGYIKATENDDAAQRIQGTNAQYQLFGGINKNVTIKNAKFVANKTAGAALHLNNNDGWEGNLTGDFNVELQFQNSSNLIIDKCSFDGINVAPYHTNSDEANKSYIDTISGCTFENVYNAYGVQGIRGGKAEIKNNIFKNCTGGIYIAKGGANGVVINGNTFSNMGKNCPADKEHGKGLIQLSADMSSDTSVMVAGNTADDSTPVLRQLSGITTIITADNKFGENNELTTVSEGGSTAIPTQKSVAAKIGNEYYPTFEAAVANAKDGDTVKLLDDVALVDGHFVINKALTLDLNQKKLIVNEEVDFDKDITINNGTIEAKNINATDGVLRVDYVSNTNSTLTLNNVNVVFDDIHCKEADGTDSDNGNTGLFTIQNSKSKLVLNNCNVTATNITNTSGVFWTTNASTTRGNVEINGGSVNVDTDKALFFYIDVNINNATITAKVGRAAFRGAEGSVKNSTVNLTGLVDDEEKIRDVVEWLTMDGTIGFENTTVTAPAEVKLVTKKDGTVLVAADSASKFGTSAETATAMTSLSGVVSKWVTDTDSGFYMDGETTYGMMRFIFTVNVDSNEITKSGVKFINPKNLDGGLLVESEDKKSTFYGDIVKIGISDLAQGEKCYAKAYVTTSAGTYWSEAVPCTMNWNQQFTEYQPTTQEVNE